MPTKLDSNDKVFGKRKFAYHLTSQLSVGFYSSVGSIRFCCPFCLVIAKRKLWVWFSSVQFGSVRLVVGGKSSENWQQFKCLLSIIEFFYCREQVLLVVSFVCRELQQKPKHKLKLNFFPQQQTVQSSQTTNQTIDASKDNLLQCRQA